MRSILALCPIRHHLQQIHLFPFLAEVSLSLLPRAQQRLDMLARDLDVPMDEPQFRNQILHQRSQVRGIGLEFLSRREGVRGEVDGCPEPFLVA